MNYILNKLFLQTLIINKMDNNICDKVSAQFHTEVEFSMFYRYRDLHHEELKRFWKISSNFEWFQISG